MRNLTILILLALVTILNSCSSEVKIFKVDNSKLGVTYKRVRGTIFNDKYPFVLFFFGEGTDSTKKWTPGKSEIKLAEQILRAKIKEVDKGYPRDYGPRVQKHLNGYFRQYVGIINEQGQKLIHINMSWDKYTLKDRIVGNSDSRLDFKSDYSIVMDGGSYYWEVGINLDEKKYIVLECMAL